MCCLTVCHMEHCELHISTLYCYLISPRFSEFLDCGNREPYSHSATTIICSLQRALEFTAVRVMSFSWIQNSLMPPSSLLLVSMLLETLPVWCDILVNGSTNFHHDTGSFLLKLRVFFLISQKFLILWNRTTSGLVNIFQILLTFRHHVYRTGVPLLSRERFLYIESTNMFHYNVFETCCTISIYSSTKWHVFHNVTIFGL